MSLLLLFIGYYLKQNNLFQRIKKQKWEEEDVKKKVRFWKENSSSTKNAGTHTHESVSARRGMHETAKKKEDYPASCTKRQKSQSWKEARSRIRTKVAGFKVQNDNQLHQSSAQHASSPNLKNILLYNSPKQQQFSFQKRTFFLRLLFFFFSLLFFYSLWGCFKY